MTPGPLTTFRLLNATTQALFVADQPKAPTPWGAYQMKEWFGFSASSDGDTPGDPPSPLCASGGNATYKAQFFTGGGDTDDAADLLVALGSTNGTDAGLFHLYAGSRADSTHYFYNTLVHGNKVGGLVVIGSGLAAAPQEAGAGLITWACLPTGDPQGIYLGEAKAETSRVIMVADLRVLYDADTAQSIHAQIAAGTLPVTLKSDLYAQVVGYCSPEATTLSYSLADITFENPPAPTQGSTSLIGQQKIHMNTGAATATQTVALSRSIERSVQLTTTTTFGLNAKVSFKLPVSFMPGAEIGGSFEYSNQESYTKTDTTEFSINMQVTPTEPGDYVVTAYVVIADDYKADFSGTFTLRGSVMDGKRQVPLNTTVLAAIMANPSRNDGYAGGPLVPSPSGDALTSTVQGTMTATFGYDTDFTVAKADGTPATDVVVKNAGAVPAQGGTGG
jgi:hypothetical protein